MPDPKIQIVQCGAAFGWNPYCEANCQSGCKASQIRLRDWDHVYSAENRKEAAREERLKKGRGRK